MQPLTRQMAIIGLLVVAIISLVCGYKMSLNNGEIAVQIALALIGIVDSVVIGILALMQGKDAVPRPSVPVEPIEEEVGE